MTSHGSTSGVDISSEPVDGDLKTDGPPSKRRRVALACNACRTRKSRCNGERPKCSLCQNLGFDCQYEPTDSSTNVIVKKEYVSDFESRLKNVEEILKRHDDMLIGHLSACSSHPDLPSISPKAARNVGHMSTASRDSIQLDASELQDLPAEEAITDGMAMSFVDEFDSAFFGPSSNIAFTRHILRAMASRNINKPKTLKAQTSTALRESGILDYSRPATPTSPETQAGHFRGAIFELPPVAELEQLLHIFFRNTGILFPFVHEPSFMETYKIFKASNFTKVRRTWLGLLNVLLAMGSSMDPSSKKAAVQRAEASSVYYTRAVKLCGNYSVRAPNLEVVQYLLLASQYLQGTQKSSQTWTLHGLAVKGAFALGLHSTQASSRFTPLENEVRKRTWFGCVLLDKVLSMTFGRPPLIPEDYIRLPLAQPWPNYKKSQFASPELQAPSMEFFNASVTLHRLIGTTIGRLYGHNLGYDAILPEAEIIPRIFELEQELGRWQTSLPRQMQIVQSNALPVPASHRARYVDRFRTMLTLRYHNLNILVHRPLLCKSLDSLAETIPDIWSNSSISRMTKDSIDACVASAEETVVIVHGILTDHSLGASVLGAWWFTLYYLFNASLVVFANSLIQRSALQAHNIIHQPPQDTENLTRAIDAFRLLDQDNRIVDRCTEYVEYLLKVLERWSQHGSQGNDNGAYLQQAFGSQQFPGDSNQSDLSNAPEMNVFGQNDGLPDLNDFLKDDLELAQFFASGIFDMQASTDSFT